MSNSPISVLIIDDDPSHLRIYGWIIGAAGYEALPALVSGTHIDFPEKKADLVVMDYRLSSQMTAVDAAREVKQHCPDAPIIVLSDVYDLPADIAPFAQAFVRKGEPARLVETLGQFPRKPVSTPDNAA